MKNPKKKRDLWGRLTILKHLTVSKKVQKSDSRLYYFAQLNFTLTPNELDIKKNMRFYSVVHEDIGRSKKGRRGSLEWYS